MGSVACTVLSKLCHKFIILNPEILIFPIVEKTELINRDLWVVCDEFLDFYFDLMVRCHLVTEVNHARNYQKSFFLLYSI